MMYFKPSRVSSTRYAYNRLKAASTHTSTGDGLLFGVLNISASNYYSSKLPIHHAKEIVKNNRLLYDIIESERKNVNIDKYLENIEVTIDKFMENNSVWDRKELLSELDDITRKRGIFACLLGGKSTGKSLVLRKFSEQEENNRKVIYVDMRSAYGTITYGFLSVALKNLKNGFELI